MVDVYNARVIGAHASTQRTCTLSNVRCKLCMADRTIIGRQREMRLLLHHRRAGLFSSCPPHSLLECRPPDWLSCRAVCCVCLSSCCLRLPCWSWRTGTRTRTTTTSWTTTTTTGPSWTKRTTTWMSRCCCHCQHVPSSVPSETAHPRCLSCPGRLVWLYSGCCRCGCRSGRWQH